MVGYGHITTTVHQTLSWLLPTHRGIMVITMLVYIVCRLVGQCFILVHLIYHMMFRATYCPKQDVSVLSIFNFFFRDITLSGSILFYNKKYFHIENYVKHLSIFTLKVKGHCSNPVQCLQTPLNIKRYVLIKTYQSILTEI